jgi:hypothetical protein
MATLAFITPEEHAADMQRLREEFHSLLQAYVTTHEEWLPTDAAMRAAGISRTTLTQQARASAPGAHEPGRITYRKEGIKSLYSRTSCIDYAQRKRGQPALRR